MALPEGWSQATDPKWRVYYVNATTKQTQWDPPEEPLLPEEPLPAGWQQGAAANGRTYYCCGKVTQWERPTASTSGASDTSPGASSKSGNVKVDMVVWLEAMQEQMRPELSDAVLDALADAKHPLAAPFDPSTISGFDPRGSFKEAENAYANAFDPAFDEAWAAVVATGASDWNSIRTASESRNIYPLTCFGGSRRTMPSACRPTTHTHSLTSGRVAWLWQCSTLSTQSCCHTSRHLQKQSRRTYLRPPGLGG